jgi:hypothetical protein
MEVIVIVSLTFIESPLVCHDGVHAGEENDEHADLKDDELDLGDPVAELRERVVGMASGHNSPFRLKENCLVVQFLRPPAGGGGTITGPVQMLKTIQVAFAKGGRRHRQNETMVAPTFP